MSIKMIELTGLLENTIRTSISNHTPQEWDEDHITLSLMRDLRMAVSRVDVAGNNFKSEVNWETYKLKGIHETNFGDIALVVKLTYKNGTVIDGVAFLEAKKRDWRKTTFSAMKVPQAKRILKNAPRAQYLLYDYDDITNFAYGSVYAEETSYYYNLKNYQIPFRPVTKAVCVPMNLALVSGYKDTLLYRHGLPLSLVLSNRYFQGLDLEFDEISKQVATGFLAKYGYPKYVLKVDINEEGADSLQKEVSINQENYTLLD